MARRVTASTQYGDLTGTIALDGYGHSFLHELGRRASIPANYFAVGPEVSATEPSGGLYPMRLSLLAADTSVVGRDGDAIRRFAEMNDAVPVRSFAIEVPFAELLGLIKRCSLVVADRLLGDTPMQVVEED